MIGREEEEERVKEKEVYEGSLGGERGGKE